MGDGMSAGARGAALAGNSQPRPELARTERNIHRESKTRPLIDERSAKEKPPRKPRHKDMAAFLFQRFGFSAPRK